MRKLVVLLAVILSLLAVILGAIPELGYALILAPIAIILAFLGKRMSKNHLKSSKTAQLAMLLSVLAIMLMSYKFIFTNSEDSTDTTVEQNSNTTTIEEEEEELDEYELELLEFREDSIRGLEELKTDINSSKPEIITP